MDTLLVLLVLLVALSSSYATEPLPAHCEDEKVKVLKELVEIHREKGDALKEMVETQRHKDEEVVALIRSIGKVEKLQTVEESQNELGLRLNQLAGRLDIIDAKMSTQVEEMESKLEAMQSSYKQALQRFEDKLEVMQVRYEDVMQRVTAFEQQEKPGSTRVLSVVCLLPFEPVGNDCVHWHNKGMTWENAQHYCQSLGAKLIVPTVKEGFELAYGTRSMSDPHPPLFDFLNEKTTRGSQIEYGWIGASVDEKNKATWTSGEELKRGTNRRDGNDHSSCIAAKIERDGRYATWTARCDVTFATPLCQQQRMK